MTKPDFEALRKARNESVQHSIMKTARSLGWKEGDDPPTTSFNMGACYCACGTGGPCEHNHGKDG